MHQSGLFILWSLITYDLYLSGIHHKQGCHNTSALKLEGGEKKLQYSIYSNKQ